MNAFKQMLSTQPRPLGTWLMSASPIVTEAMGCAGFAWGVVDMEHTPLDMMSVVHMLQAAAGTPLVPVVRVPWNDTVGIKRVLDAGAQTLLVPFVQNADEARAAVAATRYPPQGVRGIAAMGRASRFGTMTDFYAASNRDNGVIVQLETPQAIAQLEAIAAVPGVDALFLGPGDLSGALGQIGNTGHPDVLAAMQDAVHRARAVGTPIGTVGGTVEMVERYLEMGCDFVALSSDLGLLMRAATAGITTLKAHIDQDAQRAAPTIQGSY